MKKIFLLAICFVLSNCTLAPSATPIEKKDSINTSIPVSPPKENLESRVKNCICTQQWMPVCGDNGKTYSNGCFAKCAGVNYKLGSCEKSMDE